MNRADAVSFLGPRYGQYLAAVGRTASDSTLNLKEIIDDSFSALGYADADLATAQTTDADATSGLRLQLAYRLLDQVNRDLAIQFDVSVEGDSFSLSQQRAAVEKDLAAAATAVLLRFGTLDVIPAEDANPFTTLDLNFLEERWPAEAVG